MRIQSLIQLFREIEWHHPSTSASERFKSQIPASHTFYQSTTESIAMGTALFDEVPNLIFKAMLAGTK